MPLAAMKNSHSDWSIVTPTYQVTLPMRALACVAAALARLIALATRCHAGVMGDAIVSSWLRLSRRVWRYARPGWQRRLT